MCGIAGAFALTPGLSCDASAVRRMATVLRHRGPDGEGFWSDASSRLCLGHRRLSIIDLATGQQPMHDPDTGTAIVFNGEIYNYVELRQQLIDKGCTFRTESDTEVLLALYRLMGTDAFHHLRGMFALALWDPRSATLLLARDRIGKKPLYYTNQSGILYFASSFAAIATILRSPHDVDLPQLDAFLTLGYIPAPATIHPAVKKLPAGTFATVDTDGLHLSSFWDPAREIVPYEGTWDQAVERLDELVTTAVAIRLRADVPLGVLLSGGVDSSLVAAVAARRSSHPVQTFSIGFDDVHSHELSYAGAVAQHIGSDHRAFRVASDAVDLIPQLVRHFGEPFGDPSAAPAWLVAQEARRHVTVAVGGDGGDEGFAGYDWYETAARLTRVTRRVPTALRQAFSGFRSPLLPAFGSLGRLSRAAALLTLDESHRYLALRSLLDSRVARRLYSPQLQEVHRLADTERTAVLDMLFERRRAAHYAACVLSTSRRTWQSASCRSSMSPRWPTVSKRAPRCSTMSSFSSRSVSRTPGFWRTARARNCSAPSCIGTFPRTWLRVASEGLILLSPPGLADTFVRELRRCPPVTPFERPGGSSLKASARWPGSIYVATVTTACGCTTS